MNLKQIIRKTLKESLYTIRRLSTEKMDKAFEESLDYVSTNVDNYMRTGKNISLYIFKNIVINIMMDEFHGELSDWGTKDFRYDEIVDFLKDRYSNKIEREYNKLFPNKSEMAESELTEKCWPGYTQKGMKTMFGKRYPNCVKKTKK